MTTWPSDRGLDGAASEHAVDENDDGFAVITYPSGRAFTYAYDYADRPTSIATSGATIVSSAQYLPFGPLREMIYGNGSVRSTTYDNRYRIDQHSWVSGATTLASYDYAHDPAGNITQMNDLVTAGFHRQFGYDDLHRLTATSTGSQLWAPGRTLTTRWGTSGPPTTSAPRSSRPAPPAPSSGR